MLGLSVCVCVCVLEWGNGLLEQHSSGSPFHLLFPTDLLMDHATLSPFMSSDLPLCHSTPLHRKGHFTLCGGLCVCMHDCVCFKCLLLLLSALLLKQGCWCLGMGVDLETLLLARYIIYPFLLWAFTPCDVFHSGHAVRRNGKSICPWYFVSFWTKLAFKLLFVLTSLGVTCDWSVYFIYRFKKKQVSFNTNFSPCSGLLSSWSIISLFAPT